MADGKWVLTEEDLRRIDISFRGPEKQELRELLNYGQHKSEMNCFGHIRVFLLDKASSTL